MNTDGKKEPTGILSEIKDNMHREDFVEYIKLCVKKWKRLDVELQIVDAIMDSICKQWSISKKKLMEDRFACAEPRAMMYYIIKKQMNLSYGEIGELFQVSKSYVHKTVDDVTFLVENRGQKSMVNIFQSIQNDLISKNITTDLNRGIKS